MDCPIQGPFLFMAGGGQYLTLPYLTLPLMEVGWNGDGERGGLRGIFRHEMSDEYRTARTDDEFCECEFA